MPETKIVQIQMGKCVICGKTVTLKFNPFCSKLCKELDLSRWLTGLYRIPTEEGLGEDGDVEDIS